MDVRQEKDRSSAADGPRVLARIPDLNSPHNAALLAPPPANAAAKTPSVAESLLAPLAAQGAKLAAPLGKLIETIGQGAKLDPRQLVERTANSWLAKVRGWRVQPRQALSAVVAAIVVLGIILATRQRGHDTPAVDTATPATTPPPVEAVAGSAKTGAIVEPTIAAKNDLPPSDAPVAPAETSSTEIASRPAWGSPRLARIPGLSGDRIHDGRETAAPDAPPHGTTAPAMPEKFPSAALPDPRRAEIHAPEHEVPPVARLRGVIVK